MSVQLHIDRLILDGVDITPGQRPLLQAAVATELARLLDAGGLSHELSGGAVLPRVTGSAIRIGGDNTPTQLGRQIAAAVYGGIGK